jgi:hypothetical protein
VHSKNSKTCQARAHILHYLLRKVVKRKTMTEMGQDRLFLMEACLYIMVHITDLKVNKSSILCLEINALSHGPFPLSKTFFLGTANSATENPKKLNYMLFS